MRITWWGLACFRIDGTGVSVATDPYLAPDFGYRPLDRPVDLVVRSSPDDIAHSSHQSIPGDHQVVEALDIARTGPTTIKGVHVEAFRTRERLVPGKKDPGENAMYRLTVDGVRILHIGDIGLPMSPDHIDALRDEVDVLLAIAGDNYTIPLDDLAWAIDRIRPRIIIPMHYQDSKLRLPHGYWFYPVGAFLGRFSEDSVHHLDRDHVELDPGSLPAAAAAPAVYVLDSAG